MRNPKVTIDIRGRPANNKKKALPDNITIIPPAEKSKGGNTRKENTSKTAKKDNTKKKITKTAKKPGPPKGNAPRLAPSIRRSLSH